MKTKEWRLTINEKSEIFVEHFTIPRFTTQIIIKTGQSDTSVSFKSKWQDLEQGGFDWYFKALEFYNKAKKLPGRS